MLDRWFLAHPKRVGESYFAHQRMALGFSGALLKAALACFVHALVPGLFESTASRAIAELHERMVRNRTQQCAVSDSERPSVTSALRDPRSAGA